MCDVSPFSSAPYGVPGWMEEPSVRPCGGNGGTLQPSQGLTSGAVLSPSDTLIVRSELLFTHRKYQIKIPITHIGNIISQVHTCRKYQIPISHIGNIRSQFHTSSRSDPSFTHLGLTLQHRCALVCCGWRWRNRFTFYFFMFSGKGSHPLRSRGEGHAVPRRQRPSGGGLSPRREAFHT